jgi:hypothetical protein
MRKERKVKTTYVFFLGGYDAEMVTIKELFASRKIPFFDNHLSWGAALSDYRRELEILSRDQIPVLIELHLDIPYPERTVIIDHHNERAGKDQKTSIEQVAELLNIKLNRHQRLISANDRGHVPGMKAMGATEQEIRDIRQFDRQCQGVKTDDEKAAELSIQKHSEDLAPGSIYIKSLTEKTSPLLDRLYDRYRHIFIVTPSKELHYFGAGDMIQRLEKIYQKMKQSKPGLIFWKGGYLPDTGFFGSKFTLNKQQIKSLFTVLK